MYGKQKKISYFPSIWPRFDNKDKTYLSIKIGTPNLKYKGTAEW